MTFTVLLADPPWAYQNSRNHRTSDGGTPYSQMSNDDLCALPVASIAAKDSALFLWATQPKLPEALAVMAAWGFKFTTVAFTWVKTEPNGGVYSGIGHWTAGNCEIVLFGKRGHPQRAARDVKQVVVAPMTVHSRKPDEVHRRIERLMGDVPRIELFARRRVPGWVCVGNEITGNDIREDLAALRDGRWQEEVEKPPESARQQTLFAA